MTRPYDHAASGSVPPGAWRRITGDLVAGGALLLAVTVPIAWRLALPMSYTIVALSLYLGLAILVGARVHRGRRGRGLGAANRITVIRSTFVLAVSAFVVHPTAVQTGASWWVVGLSTIALILDGLDGYVARRTSTQSTFGARFDMELDAGLLMALSLLVWLGGIAGSWVLLIGALRYLFVVAGWFVPALGGDLAPSRLRKIVCVVQGAVLTACLAPVVPPGLARWLAAAALTALISSFGRDTARLLRSGL